MNELYNENEMRAYPLYENATQLCDGARLPFGILAGMSLTVPRSTASSLYLASVAVSPALVSLSVACASGGVFAGAYRQPIIPYRPYALVPMLGTASGYVVFGTGALPSLAELYHFTSVSKTVSGLDPRVIHPIETAGVTSLGRYRTPESGALTGIVRLVPGSNMTIRWSGSAIVLGLVSDVKNNFVNPCDRQAIYDNCGGPPIRTINGVQPDIQGVLTLEVNNA